MANLPENYDQPNEQRDRLIKQFDGQVEFWYNQTISHMRIAESLLDKIPMRLPAWDMMTVVHDSMIDQSNAFRDYLISRDLWDEETDVPRKMAANQKGKKDVR